MEKDARIYVAGHTGMVGSAIVRALKELNYNNLVLRTHKELDLKDLNKVYTFFQIERPDYVFMAAAKVGGIKANTEQMADFLLDNMQIQNNILITAKDFNVKKLLYLASSCIYPKDCEQPIKEEAILTGKPEITNEGYALAKITGIKACSYLNKQYGTKFISAMPANSYGINDSFDIQNSHVIPALIQRFHQAKIENKEEVILWGTGIAKREFIYVDDLASACVFLMNHYEDDEFINVGTGIEISIHELAIMIKNIVGYQGRITFDSDKPNGMLRRVIDSSKINELGWKPSITLEDGLRIEYDWFLNTLNKC